MELTLAEEMALTLKRSGIEQRQVAVELEVSSATLSRYLNGVIALPEGFEARFQTAFERAAAKQADIIRAKAEDKARRLIESVQGVAA